MSASPRNGAPPPGPWGPPGRGFPGSAGAALLGGLAVYLIWPAPWAILLVAVWLFLIVTLLQEARRSEGPHGSLFRGEFKLLAGLLSLAGSLVLVLLALSWMVQAGGPLQALERARAHLDLRLELARELDGSWTRVWTWSDHRAFYVWIRETDAALEDRPGRVQALRERVESSRAWSLVGSERLRLRIGRTASDS